MSSLAWSIMSWQGRNCSPCSSARRFIMSAYAPVVSGRTTPTHKARKEAYLHRDVIDSIQTTRPPTGTLLTRNLSFLGGERGEPRANQFSSLKKYPTWQAICTAISVQPSTGTSFVRFDGSSGFSLTYASLVQQAERPASERREAHAEHGADVAVHGGRDDPFLQAQHGLVHKPGDGMVASKAQREGGQQQQ